MIACNFSKKYRYMLEVEEWYGGEANVQNGILMLKEEIKKSNADNLSKGNNS